MTAAQLLSMMNRRKEKLSDMAKLMSRFPQVMINVKVSNEGKLRFYTDKEIKKEIAEADERLGDRGRILVRASGTEPLIRVMVEGEDSSEITSIANQAAELVRERLV